MKFLFLPFKHFALVRIISYAIPIIFTILTTYKVIQQKFNMELSFSIFGISKWERFKNILTTIGAFTLILFLMLLVGYQLEICIIYAINLKSISNMIIGTLLILMYPSLIFIIKYKDAAKNTKKHC